MNKRGPWSWVVVIAAFAALAGCSSDDGGDTPAAGTGGIGASGFGGSTSGIGGSTSGAGGMGGGGGGTAGGNMTAQPVPCGTTTCQPLGGGLASMFGIALPPPCCADEAMGICGTMTGGACMPPPESDPRCPPRMFAGFTVPSCCTPANTCGINGSQLGMGCIDPGTFTGMPGMPCDGTMTDEDGGI